MDGDSRSRDVGLARGEGYCRALYWRLTTRYHGHIIYDKAMKVRMLRCELKWGILNQVTVVVAAVKKKGGD